MMPKQFDDDESDHEPDGDWEDCDVCGGDGYDGHECGEDTCACAWPQDNVVCDTCGGKGGWYA